MNLLRLNEIKDAADHEPTRTGKIFCVEVIYFFHWGDRGHASVYRDFRPAGTSLKGLGVRDMSKKGDFAAVKGYSK